MEEKESILIVDDTPENIDVLKEILAQRYHIQVAKSGKAALSVIQHSKPDLILLDIMMSEMSGFDVCEVLKKDPETADIPVIFVTAMIGVEHEQKGFMLGGVDFITKPITPLTTLARVSSHLKLAEQNKHNKHLIDERTRELNDALKSAILMLSEAGQLNDTDTGIHMWRMADYSAAIAKAVGWEDDKVELIKLASPMHDAGKIGIPDGILKSPNKLTDAEWEIMRQHPTIGHQILIKGKAPLFQMAAEISLGHHEKWDGSGYPNGLTGKEIPESARIVALADVFDALTMVRPYKNSWPIEKALDHINQLSGIQFDPELVDIFFSIEAEIRDIKAQWDNAV